MVEEPEWPFRTWDEEQEAFQENLDHAGPPRSAQNPELLVVPLVKAQDAVARFEASVAAAPHDVAYGLRTRWHCSRPLVFWLITGLWCTRMISLFAKQALPDRTRSPP